MATDVSRRRLMRAARLRAAGRLVCERVPAPTLGDRSGHVLVRTELASICGSDVHVVHHGLSAHPLPGPPGYPGHESVGEVVASSQDGIGVGQRVLVVSPPPQAVGFAELQAVPAGHVVAVPDDLATEAALLAQQLGTVLFALKRFWPGAGARAVTIVGAGSAGLLFCQEVRRRGAGPVVVSDPEPARRARAADLGADVVVDPATTTAAEATLEVTGGRGADLVVEAAGYDDARADAAGAVALRGTLGCFGLPERPGVSPMPLEVLFRRRVTLHFEHGAQDEPERASFRAALDQIASGVTDVAGMLTHRFPLESIDEALAMAAQRTDAVCKVAVDCAPGAGSPHRDASGPR